MDIKQLPPITAAVFVCGLRADSRLALALSGRECTSQELLLSMIYDQVSWLKWAQTKDGQKGINHPEPLSKKLAGKMDTDSETEGYESPEDFEAERRRLLKGG